jgi:hypothetical protein
MLLGADVWPAGSIGICLALDTNGVLRPVQVGRKLADGRVLHLLQHALPSTWAGAAQTTATALSNTRVNGALAG